MKYTGLRGESLLIQSGQKPRNSKSGCDFDRGYLRVEFNDSHLVEQPDKGVNRIELEPANTEIWPAAQLVVIVVVSLAEHQKIKWQEIFGSIAHLEIRIAVFMGKPVDDDPVKRTHHDMDWYEDINPPGRGEGYVNSNVDQ